MLSSKEVIERSGISRATLNNYIAGGLLPRPDVLPPDPGHAAAARLGYFPDDTVDRIATIQGLKQQGWSLSRILDLLNRPAAASAPTPPVESQAPVLPRTAAPFDSPSDEPRILAVAVLAMGLHDGENLWISTPVQDYFDLVGEVEHAVRTRVRAAGGQTVRLAPDRFLCHFLPGAADSNVQVAVETGIELRTALTSFGHEWAKRWGGAEVRPVGGLAAGEAWTAPSASGDHHVMGDANAQALELARCARAGAILVTRDLVARLPRAVRHRVECTLPGDEAGPRVGPGFQRLAALASMPSLPRALRDLPAAELAGLRPE